MLLTCQLALAIAGLQQGWSDDFSGAALAPEWRTFVPVAGPTFTLGEREGWLRVSVPPREKGYCLWPGTREAPLLMRQAPEGDWRAECRLEVRGYGADSNFHVALSAFPSEGCFIGWGPFLGPGLSKPVVTLEYVGTPRVFECPLAEGPVYLALEKRGCRYEGFVRREGEWVSIGATEFPLAPGSVGLMCKTWGADSAITVDVDSIGLEPLGPSPTSAPAEVTVHTGRRGHTLSPYLYGQFIEHLERCVYGGIWAERLRNRKFAGRASEGVAELWQPVGAGEGAEFSLSTEDPLGPAQYQRITVSAGGPPRGVVQRGIHLEKGRAYTLRAVVRGSDLSAPVALSIGDAIGALTGAAVDVGPDWTTSEVTLTATRDTSDGWVSLTMTGTGTLCIGALSFMPADNVGGLRRDVLELVRELAPPILRWPGGNFASGYHWEDGIGDRDRRPTRWERAWGQWEPNDFGTDEFLRLCAEVGTVPYLCANLGEGTAREAAEWVEYCNGDATTRFGGLRATNGHVAPYGVTVWGLGNEMWGSWQLGYLPPEAYASKAVETARAMRAASPVPIQLVGVGVREDERAQWGDWNQRALPLLASECAYYSVHTYAGVVGGDTRDAQYLEQVQAVRYLSGVYARSIDAVSRATPPGVAVPGVALDEWANLSGRYDVGDGLAAAGMFHTFERLGEKMTMTNQTLMVDVMAPIRVDQTHAARTPLFWAAKLARERAGMRLVPCTVDSPPFTRAVALLDVVSALSEDGGTLIVSAINYHPTLAADLALTLEGFPAGPTARQQTLVGTGEAAADPVEGAEGVALQERDVPLEDVLASRLPASSLTVWRFGRAR